MNLVRQREDLKQARSYGLLTDHQLKEALNCPVFLFQSLPRTLSDHEHEFLMQELMHKGEVGSSYFPKVYPFKVFRISYTNVSVYEQWFINDVEALCIRSDHGYSMAGKVIHSLHYYERATNKVKFWATLDGVRIEMRGDKWTAGDLVCDVSEQVSKEFLSGPILWLAFFLLDVMTPRNAVVKISPDPKGKSVEWVKAREHYLIIGKKQAMILRERKTGPTDGEITRAAHWRIAHFRRLSSSKFTHKRGLLVPVKDTWVGPAEWIGLDGKSYKVMNLKQPE
jgi:hypothetical protein